MYLCIHNQKPPQPGSLRLQTSLESFLSYLQDRESSYEKVVATVVALMPQGRLRRPAWDDRAPQDKAA